MTGGLISMDKHPLILLYKKGGGGNLAEESEIEKLRYPFILFVGREPDDSKSVGNHIEWYDFRDYNSAFWNKSHELIGRIVGLERTGNKTASSLLKDEFERKRNSFIAYADISNQGIRNGIPPRKKFNIRENLNANTIKAHIKNLFENNFVRNKVELVIFSGVHNAGFSPEIVKYAEELCTKNNKTAVKKFAFLGNQFIGEVKLNELRNQLSEESGDIPEEICRICNEWKKQIDE